jgi:hypothetical protein
LVLNLLVKFRVSKISLGLCAIGIWTRNFGCPRPMILFCEFGRRNGRFGAECLAAPESGSIIGEPSYKQFGLFNNPLAG